MSEQRRGRSGQPQLEALAALDIRLKDAEDVVVLVLGDLPAVLDVDEVAINARHILVVREEAAGAGHTLVELRVVHKMVGSHDSRLQHARADNVADLVGPLARLIEDH